jgi:CheY-like chemotaxis protein
MVNTEDILNASILIVDDQEANTQLLGEILTPSMLNADRAMSLHDDFDSAQKSIK